MALFVARSLFLIGATLASHVVAAAAPRPHDIAAVALPAPSFAIHPVFPSTTDEVFIVHYEHASGSCWHGSPTREAIAGGTRIKAGFGGGFGTGMIDVTARCAYSIGVLGAGRHEIVAIPDSPYQQQTVSRMSAAIVDIPSGPRRPEVDLWTFQPKTLNALQLDDAQRGAVARLSNNLFAAVVHEADRDAVTLFGSAPGDWRRLDDGFPGRMTIEVVIADAADRLYVVATQRLTEWLGPPGATTLPQAKIWRWEPATGRWSIYADPSPMGGMAVALTDGRLIAFDRSSKLSVFTPGGGWRTIDTGVPGITDLSRAGNNDVYALPARFDNNAPTIARVDLDTGKVLGTSFAGSNRNPVALQPDSNATLLFVAREDRAAGLAPTWSVYRGNPLDGAGYVPVINSMPLYPHAARGDGTHLTSDSNRTVRFVRGDSTAAIVDNGLAPRQVCDPVVMTVSFPVLYSSCSNPYLDLDIALSSTQLSVAKTATSWYTITGSGQQIGLGVSVVNQPGVTPLVDLTPALAWDESHAVRPYRLLAIPGTTKLLALLHRFSYGMSLSAQLLTIDTASGAIAALAMPSVLASDVTVAPDGDIFLATRFGEILKRSSTDGSWTPYGRLSTAFGDLHPAVDRNDMGERVHVYGRNGILTAQGSGARAEEFFHPGLGHYFVTADAAERAALRADAKGGWTATGVSFPVIQSMPWTSDYRASPQPVCRFYGSLTPGPNSHFYTSIASECAGLKTLEANTPQTLPRWNFEGIAFDAINQTPRGSCADTEQLVVRYFNGGSADATGPQPNHRFVPASQKALMAQMAASGWVLEDAAWCVPLDALTRYYPR